MKVALIGSTGPVGKRLLNELVERGHQVTAISRSVGNITETSQVKAAEADVHDSESLAKALKGHDAVISAIRFLKVDYAKLIAGVKASGVKRYLIVGGAASLFAPGTTTKLIDGGMIPEEYLPEPTAGVAFFSELKKEKELDWTFLSPPVLFTNDEDYGDPAAGGRTGVFRLGLDELIVAENGDSSISYEDYAVAMIDELENPKHSQIRFTVGY